MPTCPNCQKEVPADAKFCFACGQPIAAPTASATPEPSIEKIVSQVSQASSTLRTLQSKTMSPQQFLQVARRLPLGRRPQAWWDLLSILGGATAGALWFLYGSVRATQWGWWFTLLLLAPIVAAIVYRQRLAALLSGAWVKLQKLSTLQKVLPVAALVGAYWMIPKREGLDFVSPMLMTAIPLALVWFRKESDRMLAPFLPLQRIPLPIRVGMGLAIPFATAYVLYNWVGISQYPLMRANTVVGTLLSYAVIRKPEIAGPAGSLSTAARAMLIFLFAGVCLTWAMPAFADDFLRDPFNLQDGLRTPGWAPVLAGVSTAVVTLLVNGVEVTRTVIQARQPVEDGEQAEQKNFQVVVNTADDTGAMSTTVMKETGGVTIKAHCEQAGAAFPAGDPTITFSLQTLQPVVVLKDLGTVQGRRAALITFADPEPEGVAPPETVDVLVSAGSDGVVSTTITLKVQKNDYELEFF